MPLALSVDVNLALVNGVLISGGLVGSQTCFFGDAATLACTSTNITNSHYAHKILPLMLPPFILSAVLYLVLGFIM